MAKIKITQTVSRIGSTERQKRNLDALGIKKMNQTVTHEDSPIILGMVEKVKHLVKVEVAEEAKKVAAPAAKKATAKAKAAAQAEPETAVEEAAEAVAAAAGANAEAE
jgi:large subunit ribosomal protein L30